MKEKPTLTIFLSHASMSEVLERKNVVLVFPVSLLQKSKLNNEWLNGDVAGVAAGPSK